MSCLPLAWTPPFFPGPPSGARAREVPQQALPAWRGKGPLPDGKEWTDLSDPVLASANLPMCIALEEGEQLSKSETQ
jgi:hypothetical protein